MIKVKGWVKNISCVAMKKYSIYSGIIALFAFLGINLSGIKLFLFKFKSGSIFLYASALFLLLITYIYK